MFSLSLPSDTIVPLSVLLQLPPELSIITSHPTGQYSYVTSLKDAIENLLYWKILCRYFIEPRAAAAAKGTRMSLFKVSHSAKKSFAAPWFPSQRTWNTEEHQEVPERKEQKQVPEFQSWNRKTHASTFSQSASPKEWVGNLFPGLTHFSLLL